MHSALFVAQKPEPFDTLESVRWNKLGHELRAIALSCEGIEIIAENVLLIPLPNGMQQVSDAIRVASSMPVPSRTSYFPEAPVVLISPSKS